MLKYLNVAHDHIEMAKLHQGKKCVSTIVFCKHLDTKLYSNNEYMIQHNVLLLSKITQEATKQINNSWIPQTEIIDTILPFFSIVDDNVFFPTHDIGDNKFLQQMLMKNYIKKEAQKILSMKCFTKQEIVQTILPKYNIPPWESSVSSIQENNDFLEKLIKDVYQTQLKIIEFQLYEKHKNTYFEPKLDIFTFTKDSNSDFKNQIIDEVYKTQIEIKEFETLEKFKEAEKYFEDENGNYIELSIDEWLSNWDERILELTIPCTMIEYKRIYNMPEPYHHWDNRNFWQQYFFIEDGDDNLFVHGGTGSSGQREMNGLMAHTFATLTKTYNQTIPTLIYEYNELNEFKLVDAYETFKTLPHELYGNYNPNWNKIVVNHDTIKELFDGLLINYTRTDNDYQLYDYKYH